MRFPLVASWMDAGTVDCLRDDGWDNEGIGDLACPQGVVLLDLEQPTIDSLLTAALTEYLEGWEDDDCPEPTGTWHTDGWKASTNPLCNGNQTWWWGDDEVNPDVVVVARECTTYGSGGPPKTQSRGHYET